MFTIDKPLPAITEDGAPYWEYCRQGELRMQCCTVCGHLRWPPSILCPSCLAEGGEWVPLSGRGRIYSFIVVHRPQHPAFFEDAPYNTVIEATVKYGSLVDLKVTPASRTKDIVHRMPT